MLKKVLIVALAFGAGILAYSFFGAIPLLPLLQSIVTRAQAAWTSIPETVRGIILLGIPTLFATFFAWTKTRAMQKLQQTQLEATQQITQIQGEKNALEQQVSQSTAQGIEELIKTRDLAVKDRDEAQTLLTKVQQQMRDMQNRHIGEISSLQARLNKYEPTEKVVIK